MTAAEVIAARKMMGLSQKEFASVLKLTPSSLAAIERGEVRCPKRIAREIALRAAYAQRDVVLAASGLPTCPVEIELKRVVGDEFDRGSYAGEAFLEAGHAYIAHVRNCSICRALEDYATKYAPPIPEIQTSWWIKGLNRFLEAPEKFASLLRVPSGTLGEGRRFGLFAAFVVSVVPIIGAPLVAVFGLITRDAFFSWWRAPLVMVAIAPIAYFVGLYMAGAIVDATHPIRHRLVGYMLRGGLGVPAVYGAIGSIVPLLDNEKSFADWPILTLVVGVVGAVAGGMLWAVDKIRGNLPKAVC